MDREQAYRIDAGTLIPGHGDPIQNASLIYSGSSITWVGKTEDIPDKYSSLDPTTIPVLLPGLWDCHVHFYGASKFETTDFVSTIPVVAGIRCARDARATLNAGFTSVRELAGYGVQIAQVINEGTIPGPNIYSAVSVISQTAGHGDVRSLPIPIFEDKMIHGFPAQICDGAAECIKGVRNQIRRGASVIKVATSGGIISEGDSIETQQFDDEELAAIVKEATRNGYIVAAHAHGRAGIKAALLAGCRTIEHGTYLDDELIALMLKKDAMLIATRGMTEFTASNPQALSPEQFKQAVDVKKNHQQAYSKAVKAGVRCAIGTDLGVGIGSWSHGRNALEFKFAVEAGMTPLQAIEAGTANAPKTLGPRAPKSGWLREGYDADFIALSQSPLQDIRILEEPENITHVWKGGKLYKKDGRMVDDVTVS